MWLVVRRIAPMKHPVPDLRQIVSVRQVLASRGSVSVSLTKVLDANRIGVICLDRRGKVTVANDCAREILERDDGIRARGGVLDARLPEDRNRLGRLLSNALPANGEVAVGGSVMLRGPSSCAGYVVHIDPVAGSEADFGGRVAALALIIEPSRRPPIDSETVAEVLGLTPAESEVASRLAEGRTVGEIAAATGRQRRSIYWLLEQIYSKLGIRRQVDLARLVLAVADFA